MLAANARMDARLARSSIAKRTFADGTARLMLLNRDSALLRVSAGHQYFGSGTRQGERGFIAKSSGSAGHDRELAVLGWYICD